MKEIFEKNLSLFYKIEDKVKVAKMIIKELGIERKVLIDFESLEIMISRKITESERDKLRILHNSIDEDDIDGGIYRSMI